MLRYTYIVLIYHCIAGGAAGPAAVRHPAQHRRPRAAAPRRPVLAGAAGRLPQRPPGGLPGPPGRAAAVDQSGRVQVQLAVVQRDVLRAAGGRDRRHAFPAGRCVVIWISGRLCFASGENDANACGA